MGVDTGAFAGQTAIVTGAGSGIGRAIATRLAVQGARVGLVGRTRAKLDAVADELGRAGGEATPYPADLSRDEQLAAVWDSIEKDFPRLDTLVHCAGVYAAEELQSAELDDLDAQYAVNVRAPYALTQRFLPRLKAPRGQVVFMNSSAGLRSPDGAGQYAASKHALRAVADALRTEVNSHGVRVLSVYPGQTATPMQAAIHEAADRSYRPETLLQPADVAEIVVSALALPWTAEVTDIMIRSMSKPS